MKTERTVLMQLLQDHKYVREGVRAATGHGGDGSLDNGLPFMIKKMESLEERIRKIDPDILNQMA